MQFDRRFWRMRLKAITGIALTVFLLCTPTLMFSVQSVEADEEVDWWSMFSHDPNHTGYSTSTAPNTNHTIWNYTTGHRVYSSPAVVYGKVYVGSIDSKVYCLNASTGEYVWNYTTGDAVYSSPAVTDGKVYVGSQDKKVYCLNASTGAHIWNYTTGWWVPSSPAVVDGKVYVGSLDHKVYCLDASTGEHVWSYTTDDDVESPAVAYGKVYVTSGSGKVYCLDAVTGEHAWNYTVGGQLHSGPSVVDGRVYFGSHYAYNNNVYCLNASTGAQIWNYTTGNSIYGAVAVAYGKVYVGSYDFKVYCLDAITGEHVWNHTTGAGIYSTPAVADGKVYFGSHDHKVYCLNAFTGAHIWSYLTDYDVMSSPAVADGKVYVGSEDYRVYAFASPVWSTDSTGNLRTTFNLTDNVYVSGQGFTAGTSVTVYLIPDGADALPTNAVAIASAMINSTGGLPVTLVWSQPLTLGEYDIWVDVNQNGVFDEDDVWNSQFIGIYGFDVISEFSSAIMLLIISVSATIPLAFTKKKHLRKARDTS